MLIQRSIDMFVLQTLIADTLLAVLENFPQLLWQKLTAMLQDTLPQHLEAAFFGVRAIGFKLRRRQETHWVLLLQDCVSKALTMHDAPPAIELQAVRLLGTLAPVMIKSGTGLGPGVLYCLGALIRHTAEVHV